VLAAVLYVTLELLRTLRRARATGAPKRDARRR
jgi:hypothetical protein